MNEQEDVIQDPADGSVDLGQELYNKFNKLRGRTKVTYSDGSQGASDIYAQDKDHRGPVKYKVSIYHTYYPDKENPIFPTDYLSLPAQEIRKRILSEIPEIESYPKEVLENFSINISLETVYYKEGILHCVDLLTSVEKNVIYHDYYLNEFLKNEAIIESYVLQNPPRFSDDYPLAMDKAEKKLRTVYKALQKGKWKGHEYELRSPTFVVHQLYNRYDKESRTLFPDFKLSVATYYPTLDGKFITDIEDHELRREFMSYITNKFSHFNITFS
jgi:hypothetical protein